METLPLEPAEELQDRFDILPPLDHSREAYLFRLLSIVGDTQAPSWSYEFDQDRKAYAHQVADGVNATVRDALVADACSSEDIEDIVVGALLHETDSRWFAYNSLIASSGKEAVLEELFSDTDTVVLDPTEKNEQLRASWRKFLDDFGVRNGQFSPSVRAEFVRNKVIWDTGKEQLFLQAIVRAEMPQLKSA